MRSTRFRALAAALALLLATPVFAQPDDEGLVSVRFIRREIAEVVRAIARETGTPYLFDEDLRGTVTILGGGRVTAGEALEILEAALLVRGYASIPSPGGPRKVVKVTNLAAAAPWSLEPLAATETAVTTLVALRTASAEDVIDTLRAWLSSSTAAIPYEPTNSVILAGSEDRLRRLLMLVRALDQPTASELMLRRLRHRDVDEIASLLEEFYLLQDPFGPLLEVWRDRRTNTLLARSSPARLEEVHAFLERMDRPVETAGGLRVVRVRHADPQQLAEKLRGLAADAPAGVRGDEEAAGPLEGRSFHLAVDPPTRSLLIQADPDTADLLVEIAAELDREPPRITVDALLFELISSDGVRLGVEFLLSGSLGTDAQGVITTDPDGGGRIDQPDPDTGTSFLAKFENGFVLLPLVDEAGEVTLVPTPTRDAAILAHGRTVRSRILVRPHLTMTSGDEHEIFSGDNIPIPRAQTDVAGNALQVRQNIERQDVGVRLRMTPTVGEAGGIRLALDLDLTDVAESLAGDASEVGPTLLQRRITTTLSLRDGEVVVVGLGSQPKVDRTVDGVPLLMSIPVLGSLFRFESEQRSESQLVVALQARLLRSTADDIAETIRRRLGFERSLARVGPLAASSEAPFALLVTTRSLASDAQAIAESLGSDAHPAEVVPWELDGDPRFDVYLTGYRSLADAGTAAAPVQDAGWTPEVVVVRE